MLAEKERKQWLRVGAAAGMLAAVFVGVGLLGTAISGVCAKARQPEAEPDPLETFKENLAIPEGAEDLYVSEEGLVCGFSMQGNAKEVFDGLCVMMRDHDWVRIESGSEFMGTFLRDGDKEQSWACIHCCDMNGEVSVVEEYA